ncbi:unnamed protein product, partial [Prorocentrum cordatum]
AVEGLLGTALDNPIVDGNFAPVSEEISAPQLEVLEGTVPADFPDGFYIRSLVQTRPVVISITTTKSVIDFFVLSIFFPLHLISARGLKSLASVEPRQAAGSNVRQPASDLQQWQQLTGQLSAPPATRHFFVAPEDEVEREDIYCLEVKGPYPYGMRDEGGLALVPVTVPARRASRRRCPPWLRFVGLAGSALDVFGARGSRKRGRADDRAGEAESADASVLKWFVAPVFERCGETRRAFLEATRAEGVECLLIGPWGPRQSGARPAGRARGVLAWEAQLGPTQTDMDKYIGVGGVGADAQIADGVAPAAPNSDIPALRGQRGLEQNRAVLGLIDCKLYLCGPGGAPFAPPPGALVSDPSTSRPGHLPLSVSHFLGGGKGAWAGEKRGPATRHPRGAKDSTGEGAKTQGIVPAAASSEDLASRCGRGLPLACGGGAAVEWAAGHLDVPGEGLEMIVVDEGDGRPIRAKLLVQANAEFARLSLLHLSTMVRQKVGDFFVDVVEIRGGEGARGCLEVPRGAQVPRRRRRRQDILFRDLVGMSWRRRPLVESEECSCPACKAGRDRTSGAPSSGNEGEVPLHPAAESVELVLRPLEELLPRPPMVLLCQLRVQSCQLRMLLCQVKEQMRRPGPEPGDVLPAKARIWFRVHGAPKLIVPDQEGIRVTKDEVLDKSLFAQNALLSVHGTTSYAALFGRVPGILLVFGGVGAVDIFRAPSDEGVAGWRGPCRVMSMERADEGITDARWQGRCRTRRLEDRCNRVRMLMMETASNIVGQMENDFGSYRSVLGSSCAPDAEYRMGSRVVDAVQVGEALGTQVISEEPVAVEFSAGVFKLLVLAADDAGATASEAPRPVCASEGFKDMQQDRLDTWRDGIETVSASTVQLGMSEGAVKIARQVEQLSDLAVRTDAGLPTEVIDVLQGAVGTCTACRVVQRRDNKSIASLAFVAAFIEGMSVSGAQGLFVKSKGPGDVLPSIARIWFRVYGAPMFLVSAPLGDVKLGDQADIFRCRARRLEDRCDHVRMLMAEIAPNIVCQVPGLRSTPSQRRRSWRLSAQRIPEIRALIWSSCDQRGGRSIDHLGQMENDLGFYHSILDSSFPSDAGCCMGSRVVEAVQVEEALGKQEIPEEPVAVEFSAEVISLIAADKGHYAVSYVSFSGKAKMVIGRTAHLDLPRDTAKTTGQFQQLSDFDASRDRLHADWRTVRSRRVPFAKAASSALFNFASGDLSVLGSVDFGAAGGAWRRLKDAQDGRVGIHAGIVGPDGVLRHSTEVPSADRNTFMHDTAITENFLVITDFPLTIDVGRLFYSEEGMMSFQHDAPARIGLMPRGGSDVQQWFDVSSGYGFHLMSAFEDGDDVIVRGVYADSVVLDHYEWKADGSLDRAEAVSKFFSGGRKASGIAPMLREYTGQPHRFGYCVFYDRGKSNAARSGSPLVGGIEKYTFGDGGEVSTEERVLPGNLAGQEVAYVPRPGSVVEDDGWLVMFAHDLDRQRARNIAGPPVARLAIPQRVPFGFHGCWVPGQ